MLERSITMALLSAIVPLVHAGGVADYTRIVNVDARASGMFLITVQTPATNQPDCATDHTRFSGTVNEEGGKAMFENALAALHAGATVHIEGKGSCDQRLPAIESLYRVAQSIP